MSNDKGSAYEASKEGYYKWIGSREADWDESSKFQAGFRDAQLRLGVRSKVAAYLAGHAAGQVFVSH
jgi:hypothetical protein